MAKAPVANVPKSFGQSVMLRCGHVRTERSVCLLVVLPVTAASMRLPAQSVRCQDADSPPHSKRSSTSCCAG